ncbi:hypothetical protein R3W88_019256 [Solanum pinnatisectum]|uniref:Uncharacterized protein n=1 Tax=Solanum pinnatisectum TaxID=50273 RepID=A0AAV9KJ58_9SOLN|nr:hypothetical protein R3W88_019256 [Solanum pinnatisectum]
MNRNQDTSKKEVKKDKSLALKISSGDTSSEEEDMAYLTRRFQKIVKKHGGFRKEVNPLRARNATKEYQRPGGEKDIKRDPVPDKKARKVAADYIVKRTFVVCGDSSSELEESKCPEDASMLAIKNDENVFDGMFSFMAKSDDEEDEEKVTFSDLKQNLNAYSIRKLRNLVVVLIDSVIELTAKKDSMNNSLVNFNEEKLALTDHVSVIEEQLIVLETENLELKEKLRMMSEKFGKGKGEASSLQMELEASLNTAETKLALALEGNDQMERDLVGLREELKNTLR